MRRAACLAVVAVAACSTKKSDKLDRKLDLGSGSSAVVADAAGAPAKSGCTQLPFADSTPVPEASGAAWFVLDNKLVLVVISDSGNDGAFAIVDPESGDTLDESKLPLGGDGEDLEGIATRNGKLYVITSPGWMRVYQRSATKPEFELVDGPYALGPIDIEDKGGGTGDKAPKGTGMVCGAKNVNCGRNYEGVCMHPGTPPGRCVGYGASKADGHLYCIVEKDNRLAIEHANAIRVAREGVIADCAFSDDGKLYAGSNIFDAGHVYRIDDYANPANAEVVTVGALSIGFAETLAVRGDVFYRMSDTGGAPSLMTKYRCR
jgi:hypothetical protein